jgi:hypothetical protein
MDEDLFMCSAMVVGFRPHPVPRNPKKRCAPDGSSDVADVPDRHAGA